MIEIFENCINKISFSNEKEYVDFVLKMKDRFPDVYTFENHYELEPFDEETHQEQYLNGDIQIETMKFKPESYPCIYVFCPIQVDDGRHGYSIGGMFDEFVYENEFK